jgi:hypothetical protein
MAVFSGPQRASNGLELAHDDAFHVPTVAPAAS